VPRRTLPDSIALVSGGCDSAVLLDWLAARSRRVYPVYIRFGLAWERVELSHLRRFLRAARLARLRPLTILDLPIGASYGRHWSVTGRGAPGAKSDDRTMYLPGRNLLLLSRGAILCATLRAPVMALGTLGGNPFADASRRFRSLMGRAATIALGSPVRVIAPFAGSTKANVLRQGRLLPLHLTFTCVSPVRGRHCGRCNKCAERRHGFRSAGIPDRTDYNR
jgi:7-cyano-7-deazaguanine synthase